MNKVTYNMLPLKHMLESKTGDSYSWTKMADEAHIHRNTIQKMARNKTARVDMEVIGKLITLFDSVGLEITPNDILLVTKTTTKGD